jgi:hypothetical protein
MMIYNFAMLQERERTVATTTRLKRLAFILTGILPAGSSKAVIWTFDLDPKVVCQKWLFTLKEVLGYQSRAHIDLLLLLLMFLHQFLIPS